MCSPYRARAVLAGVVLLAACTGSGDAPTDPGTEGGSAASEEQTVEEPLEPAGRIYLSGFREDQAGSLSLALRAVEIDDDGHILVDIEAVNSGTSTRRLSGLATIMVDDVGNRYGFRPPSDDGSLTLRSDERMTGTLVFEGPVDPDARHLTFGLNQRSGTEVGQLVSASDRQATDQYPPMLFADVPLPGVGLEDEASSDDGGDLLDSRYVEVGETAAPEATPEVEVTVLGYETDGRTVELDLEVVNGSGGTVRMLAERPVLTDDLGSRFHYRRVEGDRAEQRLELAPGEEGAATLGFRATLQPAATELRLTLNGFGMRNDSERTPGLVFTLPMPELDEQEDG
jgi:hypothetical protein